MIKNNQQFFNKLQILIDAVIIVTAYMSAWYLRLYSGILPQSGGILSPKIYLAALVFIVPIYLGIYRICKLYTPRRAQSWRMELWNIFRANVIGVMGIGLALYFTKQTDFSRQMLLLFFGENVCLEAISRISIRCVLQQARKRGWNQKHIILVGESKAAEQYLERIKGNPQWGYQVVGILSDNLSEEETFQGKPVLGGLDTLERILEQNPLDEVVLTLGRKDFVHLEEIVEVCETAGVHTKFIPDYGNVIPTRPYIEDVQGIPVINIRCVPLVEPFHCFVKRCVDVCGASIAMLLFSPVMLVTALLIKFTSGGPVIYKQERVGYQNRTFFMYKFRSMVVQEEEVEKLAWSIKDDPRITPVGRWIRRLSIDELPQLWNVLKGEMSLVGPRPERPQFVEQFKNEIPRYMVKHQVRPGMTGWAQVKGFRGDTSIKKRIEHDLYYIENWTLGLDLKIMIMTFIKGIVI